MLKKLTAEALGTFVIVFFGTGAIVVNDSYNQCIGHTGIALAFGSSVAIVIYAFGSISGAHFNPAVTLGLLATKQFPFKNVSSYILAQLVGAFIASGLIKLMFGHHTTLGSTLPSGDLSISFFWELTMTFILMILVLRISQSNENIKNLSGIIIGVLIFLEALVGGPISGASMNPARSIAPAVLSQQLHFLWIYLIAPVLGALLAVIFHRFLLESEK